MRLLENYLDKLYTSYEPEIRGDNKPIENIDRRPNYIGMCINMLETPQEKIGCLRKVREMTVMNPFYQHRIDRFIDAITDTYEPTDKPGFVEFIRGTNDSADLTENVNTYLSHLSDQAPSGPPPKEIQLKASGAEQDDEEPPTDERTKKFEKDKAKVGVEEVIGSIAAGAGNLIAAHPGVAAGVAAASGAYLLGKKVKKDLKKDRKQGCYDKYEGYPDKVKRCLAGQR